MRALAAPRASIAGGGGIGRTPRSFSVLEKLVVGKDGWAAVHYSSEWAAFAGRNVISRKSCEAEPWEISGSSLEIAGPAVVRGFKVINKAIFFFPELLFYFFPLRCPCSSLIFSMFFLFLEPRFPASLDLLIPSPEPWIIRAELREEASFHLGRRHFPLLLWQDGESRGDHHRLL